MPSKKLPKSSKAESLAPTAVHDDTIANSKPNRDPVLQNGSGNKIGGAKRNADESCDGVNPKRRKGLGVRIIGGRIYDSENGRTCHQCRQKMIEYMVHCTSTMGKKGCTINFCDKCLLNRYGEKATEMALLEMWICPKCRGICNCSICLKKQGRTPTGNLSKTAKATGFNSVADLLQKFPEIKAENMMSVEGGTPNKSVSPSIAAVEGLTSTSKNSDRRNPRKAVSIKAPSSSLALASLTNQDLSIASSLNGKNEIVDNEREFLNKDSRKAIVYSNNGIVRKGKAKRLKSEIKVDKGNVDFASLVQEVRPSKKQFRNGGMEDLQVSKDGKLSVATTASSLISSPAQLVKTKLKKSDDEKTAMNGQVAEERKGELPSDSRSALYARIDVDIGLANGVCPKTAVDGNHHCMGSEPDLALCNLDIHSSRRGNSITKMSAKRKLKVTVDGKVEGAIPCTNPPTPKKKAHSKQRRKQISAPVNEEDAIAVTGPSSQSGTAGQGLSLKSRMGKRQVSGNADIGVGAGKPEVKANTSNSEILSVEHPPTGIQGESLQSKSRKNKLKGCGKAATKQIHVKAAIEAQNCEIDEENRTQALPKKRKKNTVRVGNIQGTLVKAENSELVEEKQIEVLPKKPKQKAVKNVDAQGTVVKTEKCEFDNGKQIHALPKKPKKKKKDVLGDADVQTVVKILKAGPKKDRMNMKQSVLPSEVETVLPSGGPLITVSGVEFPAEAVGPALQLTEFCSAFHRILGLKKGEVEALLRELTKPRLLRRGSQSLLIQLHVKLLTLIEENTLEPRTITHSSSGKDSWLQALKSHLNEKSCVFASNAIYCSGEDSWVIPEKDLRQIKQAIEEGPEGYEKLELYHKLQLLAVLSDDCLDTECLRNFIDSVNHEFCEAQKENREEVLAARKEAKEARQKIRDAQVARLLALSNLTGPILPEEKEALLNQVKIERERVVAARSMMTEPAAKTRTKRCDAVRTDAILLGKDGRAFYRLKGGYDRTAVVFQDMSNMSWSLYSETEEAVFAKYLASCRALMSAKKCIPEENPSGGIANGECGEAP